ncbi:MAG TPA: hypothetical protein VFU49_13525 [Ktedonobacteraceae bacterium]|nr:hypothetical protein [Ktedonobacteraceae bacterium]
MMQLTEQPYGLLARTVRSEIKLALLSYLRAVLVRAEIPRPSDLEQ